MNDHIAFFKFVAFSVALAYSSIMAYLGVDKEAFGLFASLLLIDYLTGLIKARRLGHSITSNKMKYGIFSKFVLILIPFTMAILSKIIGAQNYDMVLYMGMNILAISEFYSIVGNIYSIRTKKELPEYDVVAALGNKVRRFMMRWEGDNDTTY